MRKKGVVQKLLDELPNIIENNLPKIVNFIQENKAVIKLLLSKDRESVLTILAYFEKQAKQDNDEDSLRQLTRLKNMFNDISINYQGDQRLLMGSLLDYQKEISKDTIRAEKIKTAKGRNKQERDWIIKKLNEVLELPNFDECEYRGKFSKNKFVAKYASQVNEKYNKRVTDKTVRVWINNYFKENYSPSLKLALGIP